MKFLDRVIWHACRTPLAGPMKALRRVGQVADIRRRRALAQPQEPALTANYAASLARDGFVDVSDLLAGPAMDALQAAGDAKLARVPEAKARQASSQKTFWVRLLDEDMTEGVLPTDNPFVAFAIQDRVLDILGEMLGELPQLDYVLLTLSEGTDEPLKSSQLWHKDYDDVRTVKLFVYLTDVEGAENGPFTFIPGPQSDRVGFTRRTHRSDEEVFGGSISRSDVREMRARKGAAFFVETSRCLHMGSRLAPGRMRLLYTATYTTVPRLYSAIPPRFRWAGGESERQRCVLATST